jgi:phytoene synthase
LELLEGFKMDVEGRVYRTFEDTLEYAYHVAGVVGVMMAEIMGVRQPDILARAADLGLAFQLTNIARDVLEDARGGRVYLPQEWLGPASSAQAVLDPAYRDQVFAATSRLVMAAEPYYASARWGLHALGFRSAWAIAAASGVYREIGLMVRAGGPSGLERRASTGPAVKLLRVLEGFGVALRAVTLDRGVLRPSAAPLFQGETSPRLS